MRKGKASRTARFVAYNRALGNLSPVVHGFSDTVVELFLPEKWKKYVEKKRIELKENPAKSPYPFWFRAMGVFNQFRTVILDKALYSAFPYEQLVILGAGLDSRAWRLEKLSSVKVFEVDNQFTQNYKKQKTSGLKPLAQEVFYVSIEFNSQDIVDILPANGFNKNLRTFWLWEGVTMYLAPEQVLRNLTSIASLSHSGSSLAFTYMARKNGKIPKSWFLSLIGEPPKSAFSIDEIEIMADKTGWKTINNSGIEDWKAELAPKIKLTNRNVGIQWNERIVISQKI